MDCIRNNFVLCKLPTSVWGNIPTDGALDVIIVSALPKRKIPAALVKLMKGKIRMLNETEYLRTKRLRLKGLYNIQVDGEIYENHTFDVSIVSNKLKMFI